MNTYAVLLVLAVIGFLALMGLLVWFIIITCAALLHREKKRRCSSCNKKITGWHVGTRCLDCFHLDTQAFAEKINEMRKKP
jgi:hypothetical protein